MDTIQFSLIMIAFLGGILTILAPCVRPLLPIIIGVSSKTNHKHHRHKPLIIITSFSLSVIIFSLTINRLAKQFGIFQENIVSITGWLLMIIGTLIVFPQPRNWLMHKTKIEQKTGQLAAKQKANISGDIAIGFLLGPLLQSCSPTYTILIATMLPVHFGQGLINIIAYVLGLALMLCIIIYGGKTIIKKLKRAVNPSGKFRICIGFLIVLMGFLVINGYDKQASARLVNQGFVIDTTNFEDNILQEITLPN